MSYKGQNRISFKALMHFLVIGIVCICVCAVLLGTDTYAWFYDGMHTDNSVKGSENASMLSVSVYKSGEADAIATVDATEAVTLSLAEGEYSVHLALPKQSASGYLVIGVARLLLGLPAKKRNERSGNDLFRQDKHVEDRKADRTLGNPRRGKLRAERRDIDHRINSAKPPQAC